MDSRTEHIPFLDGWRGLAITLLLVGHFFPVPGINFGHVGVNLFFVLSGLLMTRLLFVKRTPLPLFFARRASRILPALWGYVGAVLVWRIAVGLPLAWPEVSASLLFYRNYYSAEIGVMPFGHIWSLCVEEHSYILLAGLAFVLRRTEAAPLPALVALAAATAGFALAARTPADFLHSEVAAWGLLASGALMLVRPGPWRVSLGLIPLGTAAYWWSIPPAVQIIVGCGLLALALNTAAPPLSRLLSVAPLRWLGTVSYSLYLWQQPFYLSSMPRGLALLCAVLCGAVSYYLVERPAREWLNGRIGAWLDSRTRRARLA